MILSYIILGIIQGLTEFFPVSSSAHLVIMQRIFGMDNNLLVVPIVLHLGTAMALIIFFFRDIIEALTNLKLLLFIAVVTLITGIIGIAGKDFFKNLFASPKIAAFALIVTGVILLFTRNFMTGKKDTTGLKDAFILGLMQAAAIIPGISRSGITISGLLMRNFKKEAAFRLSFLVAIPAILGASLLEARGISLDLKTNTAALIAGFTASFFTGLISLWGLKLVLRKARLYYFGYYCIAVAIVTLIFIK